MEVTLVFSKNDIDYLREKFEINDVDDLKDAIFECVSTYMEM